MKKLKIRKFEDANKKTKKQLIQQLRDDNFVYLAGKPLTKEEIDELEGKIQTEKKDEKYFCVGIHYFNEDGECHYCDYKKDSGSEKITLDGRLEQAMSEKAIPYIPLSKLPEVKCNKCELYGECDHQGAYQKNGKWCYEDFGSEKPTKLKYKVIKYCSFYAGGDADGDCMLYGSNDITESRKCENINCRWKDLGEKEKNKIPDEIKPLYYKHHFPEPIDEISWDGETIYDREKLEKLGLELKNKAEYEKDMTEDEIVEELRQHGWLVKTTAEIKEEIQKELLNSKLFEPNGLYGQKSLTKLKERMDRLYDSLDESRERDDSKLSEPCKSCKHFILNINKLGHSYCWELDLKMAYDYPDKCVHCEPRNKLIDFMGELDETNNDDFYEVKVAPNWLIPKDVDDYFRNYPSDLVRIKYERLLEKLVKKEDLECLYYNSDSDDDEYGEWHHKKERIHNQIGRKYKIEQ